MPQMKIDDRSYSEPRKRDAPASNFVTFEIKGESSPESSPPFKSFFRSGHPSKSNVSGTNCDGRKTDDNVTHSGLSVLSHNCNQEDTTNNGDLGLHPSNLLNGHCSKDESVYVGNKNTCDTLFSDSLLNSLTNGSQQDNSMKIIDDSVTQGTGDFSDLLSSISFPEDALKKFSSDSNFNLSTSEVSDKHNVDVKLFKTTYCFSDDCPKVNACTTQSDGSLSDILSSISFDKNDTSSRNGCTLVNGFTTQSNGSLSDILSSISFDDNDTSMQNGLKSSPLSSDSRLCFKENQFPILNSPGFPKLNYQTSDNSLKRDSESNNGTLSDILSISVDGIDTSMQNGFKSPSNSNLCLDDIKVPILNELNSVLNFHADISKLNTSELESKGALSDILSSITFHEKDNTRQNGLKSASLSSSDPTLHLENDSSYMFKKLSNEPLKLDDLVTLPTDKPTNGIFNFSSTGTDNLNSNIQNSFLSDIDNKTIPISTINTPETSNHIKSSTNEKNGEFSFFSVSPDNVFSSILSNLKKTPESQDNNTNENSSDISMLDLLKSVNTDSNGSLSGYLSTPSKSEEIKNGKEALNTVLDNLNEMLNIDLSGCIKTSDDSLNTMLIELPVSNICTDEKDYTEIKLEDFMKPIFDNVDSSHRNRPRMNLNQSLFAKSLSCKPKKNPMLLQKVARIKYELYEHYFNHPFPDDAEIQMDKNVETKKDNNKEMVICKPNNCMLTFKGRRLCPREV